MSVATRLITADEFLAWPDDGLRHELLNGEVVSMSLPGGRHGKIALKIGRLVGNYIEAHQLGDTYAAETGFVLTRNPDTVRGADVAFVRRERLAEVINPDKHLPFAPDLAVEVLSPNDRPEPLVAKIAEWLGAGTREVWAVDPATRNVTVHRGAEDPVVLGETDILDGGSVLPGFELVVGAFFQ
jgi:Uma2 family endonuclease